MGCHRMPWVIAGTAKWRKPLRAVYFLQLQGWMLPGWRLWLLPHGACCSFKASSPKTAEGQHQAASSPDLLAGYESQGTVGPVAGSSTRQSLCTRHYPRNAGSQRPRFCAATSRLPVPLGTRCGDDHLLVSCTAHARDSSATSDGMGVLPTFFPPRKWSHFARVCFKKNLSSFGESSAASLHLSFLQRTG